MHDWDFDKAKLYLEKENPDESPDSSGIENNAKIEHDNNKEPEEINKDKEIHPEFKLVLNEESQLKFNGKSEALEEKEPTDIKINGFKNTVDEMEPKSIEAKNSEPSEPIKIQPKGGFFRGGFSRGRRGFGVHINHDIHE